MTSSFKQALADAEKQLESLVEKRSAIDRQIHKVKQLIKQLAAHSGVDADVSLAPLIAYENRGLTAGIKTAVRQAGQWKTAAEVRQILLAYGYDLSNYANSSAVINTVLNRLHKQGLIKKDTEHGTARYRWDSKVEEKIKKGWAKIKEESMPSLDVPNPFGRNLAAMLDTRKKK
jgi:hypothetical protein